MGDFLNSKDWVFVFLAIMQVLDTITGLIKVRRTEKFDKKKLMRGLAEKLLDWVFIVAAFLASRALIYLSEGLEINSQISRTIGWLVVASCLYKECRSVFKNLLLFGIKIPGPFIELLLLAEKEADGILEIDPDGELAMSLKLDRPYDELLKSDTLTVKVNKKT